jgi:hypothetical protein
MSLKNIANSGMTVEYVESTTFGTSGALTATASLSSKVSAGAYIALDGYSYTVTVSLSGFTPMLVSGVTLNSTAEKIHETNSGKDPLLVGDTSDTQTTALTNISTGATITVSFYLEITDAGQSNAKGI